MIIAGPELCRVVEKFEGVQNEFDELPHHQEGIASQRRFLCHVRDLIDVILMDGNPCEKQLRGLVSLDDEVCESPVPAHSVYFLYWEGAILDLPGKYSTLKENSIYTNDSTN